MVKSDMDKVKEALEKNGKYWIAFVGDSITSCEWVHPNWREIVEYVLKDKLQNEFSNWRVPSWGLRCFNWGFDGATTNDIRERFGVVLNSHPDLVIGLMGGNDSVIGMNKEDHKNNIVYMTNILKEKMIEFVFSTDSQPWNEKIARVYGEYVEVDKNIDREGFKFINLFKEFDKFPKEKIFTFRSEEIKALGIKKGDLDFLHPNQLGNAYIAKVILKQVFGVDFDPEKYIETTVKGYKFPEY
jgi:hypothetical protein